MTWEKIIFCVAAAATFCPLLLSVKVIAVQDRLVAAGIRLQNSGARNAATELQETIKRYNTGWDVFRTLMVVVMAATTTMSWMVTRLSVGWVIVHVAVCTMCVNEGIWRVRAKGYGGWYYGCTLWLTLNCLLIFVTLGEPWILLH